MLYFLGLLSVTLYVRAISSILCRNWAWLPQHLQHIQWNGGKETWTLLLFVANGRQQLSGTSENKQKCHAIDVVSLESSAILVRQCCAFLILTSILFTFNYRIISKNYPKLDVPRSNKCSNLSVRLRCIAVLCALHDRWMLQCSALRARAFAAFSRCYGIRLDSCICPEKRVLARADQSRECSQCGWMESTTCRGMLCALWIYQRSLWPN